ncbi:hypothetical protein [Hymenobacter saemangeumensis]
MFTRQTLRRLATNKIFARGEELWAAGTVKKLERTAPTRFAARVRGTYSYQTLAWLASGEVEFSCDCPYEFEGICKHAVALGLAILDTYADSLGNLTTTMPPEAGSLTPALAAAWAVCSDADKLRFLEQALAKSDDLARQFLAYGAAPATQSVRSESEDGLDTLAERLTDTLSALDFGEELWERHDAYNTYDEGDVLLTSALADVDDALAPFIAELLVLARGGQLTRALRYWATACAAVYQVEEPASDEYSLFDDYGEDLLRQWHEQLQGAGWPNVLLAAVLPPAELKAALKWLGDYLTKPPAQWPEFEASWLPLLLALAADTAAAPLLTKALSKAPLSPETRARLTLQTARTIPDDAAWTEAAETLLPTDAGVAQQLLYFYLSQADRPALLRAASSAFTTWPDRFGDFILNTFTPAQAPDLYRAALRHRALANHSLPDFEQLRPLLKPDAITGFVQHAASRAATTHHGVAFAAALLAREGLTNALRDFVLGLEWTRIHPPQHAELALQHLAETDPTSLMLALETRLPAYLNGRANAKRGHVLYEQLARWLAVVRHAAPRLTEPALRLAQQLREDYPTLYGLRDALRQVDLLPTDTAVPKKQAGRRGR